MSLAALLAKDLKVEWRSRDTLAAGLAVSLVIALVGNIAFSGRTDALRGVAGVVWIAVVFGAQVGLARAFVVERERGTLDGVLAGPTSSLSVWLSKLFVHGLVLLVLGIVTTLVVVLFFRLDTSALPPALVPLLVLGVLGVLGVALVTTTTSAMAMHGANWILLVPLLSLPLLFPVIAAAVPATDLALRGAPLDALWPHLRALLAFDIVIATAAWLLVPYILEP